MNSEVDAYNLIVLFIIIPLFGAIFLFRMSRYSQRIPGVLANFINLSLLIISLSVLFLNRQIIEYKVGAWEVFREIPLGLFMVFDGLSKYMLLLVNLVTFLVGVYSISYMGKYEDKRRFYYLFLLMVAGINGVILSGNLFSLYVFLEMAVISSYSLVSFGREKNKIETMSKYKILSIISSCLILLGIAILYGLTGTFNMDNILKIIVESKRNNAFVVVAIFFISAFGLKAALVPFHSWFSETHFSAPTPISAMFSSVLIPSLGIYVLLRIFFTSLMVVERLSIFKMFLIFGSSSMITGTFLALGERDLKKMLAYSNISQVGYVILSFGLGTSLGFLAGFFYLFNHSITQTLLVLNSGAIKYRLGTSDLNKMGGLNRTMSTTSTTGIIGSMSMAGIAPFGGFWSKLLIVIAAFQAKYYIFVFLVIGLGIITLSYCLRLQRRAFFVKPASEVARLAKEVPFFMKVPMIVFAILSILMGALLIPNVRKVVLQPAVDVLLNTVTYRKSIS